MFNNSWHKKKRYQRMCSWKKQMSFSFNVINFSFLLDCFTPLTLIFYLPKIPTLTTTFRRISYLTPWAIAVPPASNTRPKTHAKVDEIYRPNKNVLDFSFLFWINHDDFDGKQKIKGQDIDCCSIQKGAVSLYYFYSHEIFL